MALPSEREMGKSKEEGLRSCSLTQFILICPPPLLVKLSTSHFLGAVM